MPYPHVYSKTGAYDGTSMNAFYVQRECVMYYAVELASHSFTHDVIDITGLIIIDVLAPNCRALPLFIFYGSLGSNFTPS